MWGFCRYGDFCRFKDLPQQWCLRCLKGTQHSVCDAINPDIFSECSVPKVTIQNDSFSSQLVDSFNGEAYFAADEPMPAVERADPPPVDIILGAVEVPFPGSDDVQPTYSVRKALRQGKQLPGPRAPPVAYPGPVETAASFYSSSGLTAAPSFDTDPGVSDYDMYPGDTEGHTGSYSEYGIWEDQPQAYHSATNLSRDSEDTSAYNSLPSVPPGVLEQRNWGPSVYTYAPSRAYPAYPQCHVPYAKSYPEPPQEEPERHAPYMQAVGPINMRGEEEEEKEAVVKKVQGILNRITPEKYDVLANLLVDVLSAFMADESELATDVCKEVSGKIFEKAVSEPHNAAMYADLVRLLHATQQRLNDDRSPGASLAASRSIRFLILNRCQRQFYSKADATDDRKEREQLRDKHRKRSQGNARLVGEVYLRKLLPVAIVEEVIQYLIQDGAQASFSDRVEVLVTLLSVVGPLIDWTRPVLVACWERITELCVGETAAPRVRFLLQDFMELRASNWAPRRPMIESPKKLVDQPKGRPTWRTAHRSKASWAAR